MQPALLTPRSDGWVTSQGPALMPLMAPRLQGEVRADGALSLALWGAGDLGRLRASALIGPFAHAPNLLQATSGGVYVAQSQPVILLKGVQFQRFTPARRCAGWDRSQHPATRVARAGEVRRYILPWGAVLIVERGGDLVVAAGADLAEAERGLSLSEPQIVEEALAYVARCDLASDADPVLRSMVMQGAHAAFSAVRRDAQGGFAGLAAGLAYSAPARTYYRDGYWTLPLLLAHQPDVVRAQIDLLAHGVQDDGEAPSGVIVSGAAQARAWGTLRADSGRVAGANKRSLDWWSDHFDSPLFFVLTLGDYVRATGDIRPARRHWDKVRAILRRYVGLSVDGLPVKPRHDRDWADNVYRSGSVCYDLGLWVGALDAIVELGREQDPVLARLAAEVAVSAREALAARVRQPKGLYPDYIALDGFIEDHLTLDSLTLLRHDAVSEADAAAMLDAMATRLETRSNPDQPHGDWGVMCAWPPFSRRADLRSKTAFPYRYHNGSDWPWLDGLYAGELLRRGRPGSRYPLTRWWEVCLARGWMGAVEYFAPPWGRGSLLQGWSSMPAAMVVKYGATTPELKASIIEPGDGF